MLRLSICLILTFVSFCAQSQSDPERFEQTSTTLVPLSTGLPWARTLLKAGVSLPLLRLSSFTGYYALASIDVTVEQKLSGGLALVGGLENNVGIALDGRHETFYSIEMPVALRYYFSVSRRQKQRADRHSFFSPYVAFQAQNVLLSAFRYNYQNHSLSLLEHYRRGRLQFPPLSTASAIRVITPDFRSNFRTVGDQFLFLEYVYCQLGIQRQVFKGSYLDVNALVPIAALLYNKHYNGYALNTPALVNVKLGMGWWR